MGLFARRGLLFILVPALLIIMPFTEALAGKRIGILISSEQERYYESKNGIVDQLKKDGFKGPETVFVVENANGSKARMVKLAQQFIDANMDIVVSIGTGATLAVAKMTRNIPIVFSTVYDPVEAGIAEGWKSSGNNTTGATTRFPMSKLVASLTEFAPVKRLAVLYTPGEKNSEAQLLDLQKSSANLKIIPIILNKKEEVAQALSEVVQTADALYLTGSSIIGATVPAIVNTTNKSGVITVTHLDDLVAKGALLGVCANSYQVGRLAGKKAAQILNGAKPSLIPIEATKKVDIILNKKTLHAGQFQAPPSFMKKVTKIIE